MNKMLLCWFLFVKKSKTSQFSTEALIGLVFVYNHQVLYRIVASKAHCEIDFTLRQGILN